MNRYVISEEELKAAILIVGEAPTKVRVQGLYDNLHKLPVYVEQEEEQEDAKDSEESPT